jgi:hypothetical protein
MFAFARTMESPCRSCEYIHHDKDECAKDCDRLNTFQAAILRHDEVNIKNFEVRSLPARKAV